MSKTKKVIFVVLSALICVFTLSFNFFKISDNTLKVKADTSTSNYVFDGSNIYTPIKRGTGSDNIVDFLMVGLQLEFDSLNNTVDIVFKSSTGFWTLNRLDGPYNYADFDFSGLTYSDIPYSTIFTGSNIGTAFYRNVPYSSWDGSSTFGFACYGSSSPVGEIIGVSLGNTVSTFSNFSQRSNYISYFDSDGNFITFYFWTIFLGGGVNNFDFVDRTYYFLGADDFSDNQIYNQGYQEGLLDNQTNIYDNGYKAGNTVGYSNGYNAGLNDSNQYTFLNLFGAVLDAPISTLTGLLNFELFGVNMLTLFTGLLTLAIILLVFRLIRGG